MTDADADPRMRAVVLDTGAPTPAAPRAGRAARALLGVAVGAILLVGTVTAGGWSILTAVRGGTPAGQPVPLWYPTPNAGVTGGPATTPAPDRGIVPAPPPGSAGPSGWGSSHR